MPKIETARIAVLDTHVWIWLSSGDPLGRPFASFAGQPVLSDISVWEVAMLASKQRLTLKPDPQTWIETNLKEPIETHPLSPAICVASCNLEGFHGDPADRLIVATALVLGIPLITADRQILSWAIDNPALQILS